jgi:hypothetical protein
MNTPVSFELAKLLNDKGLPGLKSFYDNKKHYELNPKKYTIAEVVMWLYEKHGLWVEVIIEQPFYFGYDVFKVKNNVSQIKKFISYNSPTEAYEAAIEYTLNNLI